MKQSKRVSVTSLLVALAFAFAAPVHAGDAAFLARLARGADGRVVVIGRADLPDGAWVYVEVIADPGRADGVFADAVPVAGGAFALATPFAAELPYTATCALSPRLSPGLDADLARLAETPGAIRRDIGATFELIVTATAAFGDADVVARRRARLAESIEKDIRTLRGATEISKNKPGAPALADALEELRRAAERGRGAEGYVYAAPLAAERERAIDDATDALTARLRATMAGRTDAKADEKLARARRRLDRIEKALTDWTKTAETTP
ncbi:hypothetical protein K8I61_05915 [bacterium]|nr:hypothetical protein [bacterium]